MAKDKRHRVPPRMTRHARTLRREGTFPERLLWQKLRDHQMDGVRFRRQHVIGPYVTDFFCAESNLVVELDGHSHDTTAVADLERERYLQRQGLLVIRFSNDDVIREIDRVLEAIASAVAVRREAKT